MIIMSCEGHIGPVIAGCILKNRSEWSSPKRSHWCSMESEKALGTGSQEMGLIISISVFSCLTLSKSLPCVKLSSFVLWNKGTVEGSCLGTGALGFEDFTGSYQLEKGQRRQGCPSEIWKWTVGESWVSQK